MESRSGESGKQPEVSPGLIELIGRAITDESFRETLYSDRDDAVKGYMLTESDKAALAELPRDALEQQAQRFGTSSAVGVSIGITVKGSF
jgi:hypothetical protein